MKRPWLGLVRTLPRLGPVNLARVALYRLRMRSGYYKRILPIGPIYSGPFWQPTAVRGSAPSIAPEVAAAVLDEAEAIRAGRLRFFSSNKIDVGFPPQWLNDAVSGKKWPVCHWTQVDEFGVADSDIKHVWEPSRFDGLLVLAAAATLQGEGFHLAACNRWVQSWIDTNRTNEGPNWRCAQETALRLLNVLAADLLLRDARAASATPALTRFVLDHCRRIAATMLYAIAQDNNHASSEAASLYSAGLWLVNEGASPEARNEGGRFAAIGRRAFERCVLRLVLPDGTFSQYSLNYHRLFLDTACLATLFQQRGGAGRWSAPVAMRLQRAAQWLRAFVDPVSGDGPNLGANDGARLLQISGTGYRDYRPSTQLACALFCEAAAFANTPHVAACLHWFRIELPRTVLPPVASALFADGGFAVLVRATFRVYLRLPVVRFRPGQADFLHVDIWIGSQNVARDAGTYSYNTQPRWMDYFAGTGAHNTVQFDGRDQMPRLSRFLFGDWPKLDALEFDASGPRVRCAFTQQCGARHSRTVELTDHGLVIEDQIEGGGSAVSRLRLQPDHWAVHDGSLTSGRLSVSARAGAELIIPILTFGYEAREYDRMTELPVAEVRVDRLPARLTWSIRASASS